LKPDYAEAWNNKSAALGRLGRFEEALHASNKAIELKPWFAVAWCNKGAALGWLGLNEEAIEAYEKHWNFSQIMLRRVIIRVFLSSTLMI
jgi:tetratricopeptide (TPR) repeat protein